ncbi:hypothetical protein RFI_09109 [Reticulomyxa filosa]|uniref:Kelch motif family protein n=1 Tax=Reticulomyxa filosa TaxID=46433 RepID=X6NQ26_RETFI|nr:hypothetical protein RFI_09109 [Reticulomyxa filosa]|eukprot:ETO28023.1 hypothetical protein RFI_09109 [Reticulomyxa filosa]
MSSNDDKAKQVERTDVTLAFETLAPLPILLSLTQAVVHKHEILICGGFLERSCFSYHTLKNQYKYICSYPKDVALRGHCVVKRVNNDNPKAITLLSFGGQRSAETKHTLILKYISVWNEEYGTKIEDETYSNEWLPFTDMDNNPVSIGRKQDNYEGVRAVIGGRKDNLLFISYRPKNIDVFDLDTFQYISQNLLPIDCNSDVYFHCFMLKPEDPTTIRKTNAHEKKNGIVLFCENVGLLVEYNEDSNAFEMQKLRVCSTIRSFNFYAYVRINSDILFFGGYGTELGISRSVHKYSMIKNKWIKFEHNLAIPLFGSIGILNDDNKHIHILGGRADKGYEVSTHMKADVMEWMKEKTEVEAQWSMEETKIEEEEREKENVKKEIEDVKRMKKEIEEIKQKYNLETLNVD